MDDQTARGIAHPGAVGVPCETRTGGNPRSIDVLPEDWDKILRPRQDEDIGLECIVVSRESLVGLAADLG